MSLYCEHVYKNIDNDVCPHCGGYTHRIDWVKENEYHKQWRLENPNPPKQGWWSI